MIKMAKAKEYKRRDDSTKKMRSEQVLGRVFRKLFKPRSIPRPIIFLMPLLVALIVALFSQYVVILPVKGSSAVPYLILAGLIIGAPLTYKFRAKKIRGIALGAAIVIGFFLVPYFAFLTGQMQLYAVDQLPPEFKVIEMRISFEKVVFVDNENNEVTAWSGPKNLTLRPGRTRVHVGTLSIPAGSYVGRRVYMNNVDMDLEVDLTRLPPYGGPDPYEFFEEQLTRGFQSDFPQGSTSNWSWNGLIGTFTTSTGPHSRETKDYFDYRGYGGPDITLDYTLTEDGRLTVTPILDSPPGIKVRGEFPPPGENIPKAG